MAPRLATGGGSRRNSFSGGLITLHELDGKENEAASSSAAAASSSPALGNQLRGLFSKAKSGRRSLGGASLPPAGASYPLAKEDVVYTAIVVMCCAATVRATAEKALA